jgi:hypothetical protein
MTAPKQKQNKKKDIRVSFNSLSLSRLIQTSGNDLACRMRKGNKKKEMEQHKVEKS